MGRAEPLREPAGFDAQPLELVARRLVAGATAIATPTRNTVHDRDVRTVFECTDDLVPEHRAAQAAAPELLDVGAAQTAGEYADEVTGTLRVGNLGEPGRPVHVEHDRTHATILGRVRAATRLTTRSG